MSTQPRTATVPVLVVKALEVDEPDWCTDPHTRAQFKPDITHNGPTSTTDVVTARYGRIQVLETQLTQAPHGERQPEPLPLLSIRVDIDATVATEDGQHLAQALRIAAARLDRALDELAHLRGERR
ncbi:hypothetical protein ABZ755_15435 [Streptomyces griseoincarnatus]